MFSYLEEIVRATATERKADGPSGRLPLVTPGGKRADFQFHPHSQGMLHRNRWG
jgi:hypothetical protein